MIDGNSSVFANFKFHLVKNVTLKPSLGSALV